MNESRLVENASALLEAVKDNIRTIYIDGTISDAPRITLNKNQSLVGKSKSAKLVFKKGQPGIFLGAGCALQNVEIVTDLTQVAVGLLDEGEDLGHISVSNVTTTGRFHLEAQNAMNGDITLSDIRVKAADARMAAHRPAGFGVEVLLGGLSVYNSSRNPKSVWRLRAENLSCGSEQEPVQGSGIFVFGGDFIAPDSDMRTAPAPKTQGGQIEIELLSTGPVYTNGGIPHGIGNLITGGVFLGSGAHAKTVTNYGAVTTYGPNDMVLDNWGRADLWTAKSSVTSHGPSGIGFVNFGTLEHLVIESDITTYGLGARGFNLYDGVLNQARFKSIVTHGDGAIGIQISKPFGSIEVTGDVVTHGGMGESLVRGKVVPLKAHALSLKEGAAGKSLSIIGSVRTDSPQIEPLDLGNSAQAIEELKISSQKLA